MIQIAISSNAARRAIDRWAAECAPYAGSQKPRATDFDTWLRKYGGKYVQFGTLDFDIESDAIAFTLKFS